jgi:hypothetical protein
VTASLNGNATELFALTDEQILEIEPERPGGGNGSGGGVRPLQSEAMGGASGSEGDARREAAGSAAARVETNAESGGVEPPAWLAEMMNDSVDGAAARELWNGVQRAQAESAAYRAAFASPEEARALKELYPGGLAEARAAAERARALDEIDSAYLGAVGSDAEAVSARRMQLAERMLRENPSAFREMVFAGLRTLEQAGASGVTVAASGVFQATGTAAKSAGRGADGRDTAEAPGAAKTASEEALARYTAFERAANDELERSVGKSIARALEQTLPGSLREGNAPLRERLSAAVRRDVEAALQSDRQLGEQVARVLAGSRFDQNTRAQVVRLIDARAQQLVGDAARRAVNDWTLAAMTAHRERGEKRTHGAGDVFEANGSHGNGAHGMGRAGKTDGASQVSQRASKERAVARRPVDYRKLSDEQILEM